jgi:hypothetical protein
MRASSSTLVVAALRTASHAETPFTRIRVSGSRIPPAELCEDERMPRHGSRALAIWSWLVLVLVAAHDVTHAVDDGLETRLGQLALIALPQWLVLAVVMSVILRGDRARSRTAALLLGISVAVGFAVVHLLPLSPAAFWELQPSVVSWVLAWLPAAVGLVLATLAWPRRRAALLDEVEAATIRL